eukprot:10236530-Alexandrium_andersonii.AAC.1
MSRANGAQRCSCPRPPGVERPAPLFAEKGGPGPSAGARPTASTRWSLGAWPDQLARSPSGPAQQVLSRGLRLRRGWGWRSMGAKDPPRCAKD